MKRIVLMGNPNIGKSVVFSRLTGAEVITSNYPGTTVDFSRGRARIQGEPVELIDAPGTYSLQPTSPVEEVAVEVLRWADLIVNVVDSTNLERNLFLTLELLEQPLSLLLGDSVCRGDLYSEHFPSGINKGRESQSNLFNPLSTTVRNN